MEELDDSGLLRRYVENQSDEAFAALVTRRINLVYSVALRQTGSPENAEEIAQAVFIILARRADTLRHEKALSSWLFQATRLTAANLLRSEIRRRNREQEAYMQSALNDAGDDTWAKMAPLLDSAVASLREKERRAILLRFYEGRNLQEVGAALGASENAAGKRVKNALDSLRRYFSRRGVSSTTAIIGEKISAHSVQAAPAALAKAVAAVAIAKGVAGSASTLTLVKGALKLMAWTKAKTAIIAAGILLVAGTGAIVVKESSPPSEPSYQGRRLSEWLVDVDYGQPQDKRQLAREAIRKMGPKTVPFLLAALGDEKYTNRYQLGGHLSSDALSRQATWGFDALGPIGKFAIPELQKIVSKNPGYVPLALGGIGSDAVPELLEDLTNEDFFVRDNTAAALANAIFARKISPEAASAAFPIALTNLTYTDANSLYQVNTRYRAAGLLQALKQSPEVSVPALMAGLHDPSASVAAQCAAALAGFGEDAKVAIPDLTEAANSTNELLRVLAKQSLEAIQNPHPGFISRASPNK
jgi:RNA polymerase sigma factor (sigma-70 family)